MILSRFMRLLLTFKIFVVVVSAWVTVANQQSSQHQQELRDLAAGAKPRKQKVQENPQHQKMTREGSGQTQKQEQEKLQKPNLNGESERKSKQEGKSSGSGRPLQKDQDQSKKPNVTGQQTPRQAESQTDQMRQILKEGSGESEQRSEGLMSNESSGSGQAKTEPKIEVQGSSKHKNATVRQHKEVSQAPAQQPQQKVSQAHDQSQQQQGRVMKGEQKLAEEAGHIQHHAEHVDTGKMTEQELRFHYFKMHDTDGNHKLDGLEMVKSLIHWHTEDNFDPESGVPKPDKTKIFRDEELTSMIDPILERNDKNKDGYIDYPEFITYQQSTNP